MRSDNGLPDGWRARRIADVAKVRFSGVDKRTEDGEKTVRLCNYMEVWKNNYIRNDMPFMTATANDREISQFSLRPHDVLLTKDSETKHEIAQASVVRDELDNVILGYHLALIRPNPKKAHGPFVSAQLNEPHFRQQFVRVTGGATRYGLGLEAVRGGVIWLPDVTEQRRIADTLEAVDNAIRQTRSVIDQTRRLRTALLQDLLAHGLPGRKNVTRRVGRLGEIPADWRFDKLERLISNQPRSFQSGPFGSNLLHSEFQRTGRLVIGIDNVLDGRFVMGCEHRISEAKFQELERYRARPLDVVITVMATVGRCAVIPHDIEPAIITKHVYRISVDPTWVNPHYLMWTLLASPIVLRQLYGGSQGQTRDGLNGEILKRVRIPLPPKDDQDEAVSLLSSIDARIEAEEERADTLSSLKAAISQALLSGRVRCRKAVTA